MRLVYQSSLAHTTRTPLYFLPEKLSDREVALLGGRCIRVRVL